MPLSESLFNSWPIFVKKWRTSELGHKLTHARKVSFLFSQLIAFNATFTRGELDAVLFLKEALRYCPKGERHP